MKTLPLILLGLLTLPVGGCARSDDGTVIIPTALDSRRIWEVNRPHPKPVKRNASSGINVFPTGPQTPRTVYATPDDQPRKRIVRTQPSFAATEPEQPAKGLSCTNVSQPGQRAKMVCE